MNIIAMNSNDYQILNQIEVINILKACSDKKTGRLIKSPAFLLATMWSHSAYSWPGLK